jgi:hypothetical protein
VTRSLFAPLFLVVVALACKSSQAAIIARDFLTPGDNLLTYDSTSGREWLDVTHTAGLTREQVAHLLGADQQLAGFRIASPLDVVLLAKSAGYDETQPKSRQQFEIANRLIDHLGKTAVIEIVINTYDGPHSFPVAPETLVWRISDAYLNHGDNAGWVPFGIMANGMINSRQVVASPQLTAIGSDVEYPGIIETPVSRGVWLFREAVPEPRTIAMLFGVLLFQATCSPRCRRATP